jgi:NAD(P)-dependent dehydrogenase (short-subunit alcohol dehydrogenase family)
MRNVLVTAGASGIGKEIASAFLAAGDSVYTCDIDRAALEGAARELPGLRTGLCDVGDRKQIESMMADAVSQLGGIDILVNNAGISGPTAPVQDVDPDKWEAVLKVDLTGTFLITKAAIPHLIASGHGVIIIMSSAAGRFGYPNRSPYFDGQMGPDRLYEDALDGARNPQRPDQCHPSGSRRWRAHPEGLPGSGGRHGRIARRGEG